MTVKCAHRALAAARLLLLPAAGMLTPAAAPTAAAALPPPSQLSRRGTAASVHRGTAAAASASSSSAAASSGSAEWGTPSVLRSSTAIRVERVGQADNVEEMPCQWAAGLLHWAVGGPCQACRCNLTPPTHYAAC